jgi:hypothetical protein
VSLLPRASLQLQTGAPQTLPAAPAAAAEPKSIRNRGVAVGALCRSRRGLFGALDRALISGSAEAAIWISYATFRIQENVRGDRAKEYAVSYAGALGNGGTTITNKAHSAVRARPRAPALWNEYVRRKERDEGEEVGASTRAPRLGPGRVKYGSLQYRHPAARHAACG